MIIAVDAAGGDYAPHEIVKGAIMAAQEYEIGIALVGKQDILHVLTGRHTKKLDITIVNASQVIEFRERPMEAVRNKPDSSIVVGINLVRDGVASAFVSAGSTGAVLVTSLLNLGRIKGLERPALCTLLDITSTTPSLLIDSAANADCRPNFLVQFAQLGTVYAREVIGIDSPKVGLLNNGTEDGKGNRLAKETFELLKKTKLNFIGNIEGLDIMKRKADVIVTDGFTGNVVIKTIEGFGDSLVGSLQHLAQAIVRAPEVQGRALLHSVGLGSWGKRVDYREYGGACLLGVNGNVIVAHGRSRAKTIKTAIGLAKRTAERGISEIIKEGKYV